MMTKFGAAEWLVIAASCLAIGLGGAPRPEMCPAPFPATLEPAAEQTDAQATPAQGEKAVTQTKVFHAKGTFEPKLVPQPPDDKAEGSTLGRMVISKKFHGDLDATSEGQMLTAMTDVKGSAGYVAIERVTGTVGGRRGSFVLQHMGTLDRGAPQQSVTIVPDSGTGELAGIMGTITIQIAADGTHSYDFAYTLPEKK